jgi:uncharacterized membrane protein
MPDFGRRGQKPAQTTWRPSPKAPAEVQPAASGDGYDRRDEALRPWALTIWGLYLASFLFGITSIVAVILAYIKRGAAAGTRYESHMTYAIRTFWIAFFASIIALVAALAVGTLGYLLILAVAIWQFVRCIRGLIAAFGRMPVTDPNGWL